MDGITVQQRLEDISRRSGVSVETVRVVLKAEADSIANSLKRGERATLIGRVSIKPELRLRLGASGKEENCIKVSMALATAMEAQLSGLKGYVRDSGDAAAEDAKVMERIICRQIPALAE